MKELYLHPIFIHFPIAFYFLELILLILWKLKTPHVIASPPQRIAADKDILDYRRFALFSFKLGYLFMIVAMVTGLRDAGGFSKITGLVRPHFFGALIIFALYTLRAFGWRIFSQAQKGYAWIQIGGAVLGYAAVIFTAFFGGRLVYG